MFTKYYKYANIVTIKIYLIHTFLEEFGKLSISYVLLRNDVTI